MKIFNIYLNGVYIDTTAAYNSQTAIDYGEDNYARDSDIVTVREIQLYPPEPEESETTSNDSEGSC